MLTRKYNEIGLVCLVSMKKSREEYVGNQIDDEIKESRPKEAKAVDVPEGNSPSEDQKEPHCECDGNCAKHVRLNLRFLIHFPE